ncbi:MAG TPA: hypothetical protein PKM25_08480, partial [Candidatus Ozemobacteraceae bacterium]|nr:hypothetical protein [Candidatus Ozemobacteraceae bacterium]
MPAEDTSMKAKAEQKISELLGVPVSVKDYTLDFTTARLHGITIGNRDQLRLPFAEVQDLSATCNVVSLLTGNLVLEEITIASLSGRLTRDSSGALVLGSFPIPASGAAVLEPTVFPFQKIHGTNLRIQLLDEGLKKTVSLRLSSLEAAKSAGDKVVDVQVSGALSLSGGGKKAKLPECPFHGTFQAAGFSPFLASGSAALGPALASDLQTILEGVLPGSSGKIQFQSGTAEAGLEFSSLAHASPDTKAWARLRGVSLRSPSSKLRVQNVSGDVSFSGTWNAGVLNGSLNIAKLHGTVGDGKVPIGVEALRVKADKFGRGAGMLEIKETDLTILGTALRVSGTLKPADTPKLRLAVQSTLDLTLLHKNLPGQYDWFRKGTSLSGKAIVAAEIIGSLQDPAAKAEIRLTDGEFAYPEKKVQVKKLDIAMRADSKTATLSDLKAVTAGGNLAMNGTVKDLADPTLALSGTLEKADSAQVLAILRTLFPTIPRDLKFSGNTDIEFILDGKANQPRIQGAAAFQGAGMEFPMLMRPLSQIKGTVQFDNKSLRTNDL